jgi:hypothetical protein
MIPTKETENVTLWLNQSGQLLHTNMPDDMDGKYKGQHLYIVSDDVVELGDYHIAMGIIKEFPDKCIAYTDDEQLTAIKEIGGAKKVIVTTDSALSYIIAKSERGSIERFLPKLSQSFIEYYVTEYNKGNIITDVVVEYETVSNNADYFTIQQCEDEWYQRLKINDDNTVNVIIKDLNYWKDNAEEDYMTTPISVLKYITELELYIEKTKTIKECQHIAKVAFRMGQQQPTLDYDTFIKWLKRNC